MHFIYPEFSPRVLPFLFPELTTEVSLGLTASGVGTYQGTTEGIFGAFIFQSRKHVRGMSIQDAPCCEEDAERLG